MNDILYECILIETAREFKELSDAEVVAIARKRLERRLARVTSWIVPFSERVVLMNEGPYSVDRIISRSTDK